MKRLTLLTLASLLWVGTSAAFAAPAAQAVPAVTPGCGQLSSGETPLPQWLTLPASPSVDAVPLPFLASSADYCGVCSPPPCVGALRGTPCGGGFGKRCEYYLDSCEEDGQANCRCYAGPIP